MGLEQPLAPSEYADWESVFSRLEFVADACPDWKCQLAKERCE